MQNRAMGTIDAMGAAKNRATNMIPQKLVNGVDKMSNSIEGLKNHAGSMLAIAQQSQLLYTIIMIAIIFIIVYIYIYYFLYKRTRSYSITSLLYDDEKKYEKLLQKELAFTLSQFCKAYHELHLNSSTINANNPKLWAKLTNLYRNLIEGSEKSIAENRDENEDEGKQSIENFLGKSIKMPKMSNVVSKIKNKIKKSVDDVNDIIKTAGKFTPQKHLESFEEWDGIVNNDFITLAQLLPVTEFDEDNPLFTRSLPWTNTLNKSLYKATTKKHAIHNKRLVNKTQILSKLINNREEDKNGHEVRDDEEIRDIKSLLMDMNKLLAQYSIVDKAGVSGANGPNGASGESVQTKIKRNESEKKLYIGQMLCIFINVIVNINFFMSNIDPNYTVRKIMKSYMRAYSGFKDKNGNVDVDNVDTLKNKLDTIESKLNTFINDYFAKEENDVIFVQESNFAFSKSLIKVVLITQQIFSLGYGLSDSNFDDIIDNITINPDDVDKKLDLGTITVKNIDKITICIEAIQNDFLNLLRLGQRSDNKLLDKRYFCMKCDTVPNGKGTKVEGKNKINNSKLHRLKYKSNNSDDNENLYKFNVIASKHMVRNFSQIVKYKVNTKSNEPNTVNWVKNMQKISISLVYFHMFDRFYNDDVRSYAGNASLSGDNKVLATDAIRKEFFFKHIWLNGLMVKYIIPIEQMFSTYFLSSITEVFNQMVSDFAELKNVGEEEDEPDLQGSDDNDAKCLEKMKIDGVYVKTAFGEAAYYNCKLDQVFTSVISSLLSSMGGSSRPPKMVNITTPWPVAFMGKMISAIINMVTVAMYMIKMLSKVIGDPSILVKFVLIMVLMFVQALFSSVGNFLLVPIMVFKELILKIVVNLLILSPEMILKSILFLVVLVVTALGGEIYKPLYQNILAFEKNPRAFYLNSDYFGSVYNNYRSIENYYMSTDVKRDLSLNDLGVWGMFVMKPANYQSLGDSYSFYKMSEDGKNYAKNDVYLPSFYPDMLMIRLYFNLLYQKMIDNGIDSPTIVDAHNEIKSNGYTLLPANNISDYLTMLGSFFKSNKDRRKFVKEVKDKKAKFYRNWLLFKRDNANINNLLDIDVDLVVNNIYNANESLKPDSDKGVKKGEGECVGGNDEGDGVKEHSQLKYVYEEALYDIYTRTDIVLKHDSDGDGKWLDDRDDGLGYNWIKMYEHFNENELNELDENINKLDAQYSDELNKVQEQERFDFMKFIVKNMTFAMVLYLVGYLSVKMNK
jgi:hypothetical protein